MSLKENEYFQHLKTYPSEKTQMVEVKFNFEEVQDLFVRDELGGCVRFGDIYANKKSIIHFLCFTTSDYVEDLMKVPPSLLSEGDVQLILIGFGDYRTIAMFRKEKKLDFPIFVDPDLDLYNRLNFHPLIDASCYGNKNAHVKSGLAIGILRSSWRAMKYRVTHGNVHQNGGAIVIGPGNQLHLSHIDKTMFDKILINDLLVAAGLQPMSFKNDQRVETV